MQGLGFNVQGLSGARFRVQCARFRLGLRVESSSFKVEVLGLR